MSYGHTHGPSSDRPGSGRRRLRGNMELTQTLSRLHEQDDRIHSNNTPSSGQELRELRKEGILTVVADRYDDQAVNKYALTEDGAAIVRELVDGRPLLPCGHPPFTNPRGVEGLSCSHDDCDAVFDRETVREVVE